MAKYRTCCLYTRIKEKNSKMIRITIQKNSLVPQFMYTYQLDIWRKSKPSSKGNPRNSTWAPKYPDEKNSKRSCVI